ncbi:MAG: mechanosensitive ion channel domain-containing protein [Candidatus Acidiferrales bacterium]
MKKRQRFSATVLVLLLGATIYGFLRTGRPAAIPTTPGIGNHATATQVPLVDQTPLETAQRLAKMPTSSEELAFAQEALRLGDQEMDRAFAAAVRDATVHPPVLSAEAKEIETRLQKAERALEADKVRVQQLSVAEEKASGEKKDALDDQLDLAKAQVELDQDEVDDAKQDLIRAGGDPQGRIQTMVEEHQAASSAADSLKVQVATPVEERGLIHQFQLWSALHEKQLELWRAKREAESAAASFSVQHNALAAQIDAGKRESTERVAGAITGTTSSSSEMHPNRSRQESIALLKTTKRRAADQKTLANFDKRIDNQKQLADVYGKWIDVIAAKQRSVIHGVLNGLAIVLGILLIGVFFDNWLERLLGKTSLDRRQVETLRTVTRVALQVGAVVFILLVIFGPPGQLGTFLGLAGAGLTVALKDFIVAFIGWLVLMGKDGIRLGDWVEINGVTGEVVQLGMFHTVLLETGNWTDSGHPTGRRVTFTNSFAIEGHYFNFSTSGQWLWDELQIVLPAGQDPYPIVDAIQKKVIEVTAESARQAEQEWQGAARSRDMKALSAAPAINVKPIVGGIEIAVRYITRANERYQLRAKLNQAAVDLLGGKSLPVPQTAADQLAPRLK